MEKDRKLALENIKMVVEELKKGFEELKMVLEKQVYGLFEAFFPSVL